MCFVIVPGPTFRASVGDPTPNIEISVLLQLSPTFLDIVRITQTIRRDEKRKGQRDVTGWFVIPGDNWYHCLINDVATAAARIQPHC
jgi:hypothetical protein